jgi:outer membrane protein OmpA-like peptidoglycan-associated protein
MRPPVALLAGALLCAAPRAATADGGDAIAPGNGDGMSLRLFRPAIDSKGIVTTNATAVLGHLDPSFGLVLDAGLGLLPVGGGERLVDGLYTGTFTLGVGLFDVAVVGLQLPVSIGRGESAGPVTGLRANANSNAVVDLQALGDLTLTGKLRLLSAERSPVGLALALQVGLPTGAPRSFGGEPGGFAWPTLVAEVHPARRLRIAIDAGARFVFGQGSTVAGVHYGSQLTAALGASFALLPGTVDWVAEVYGATAQRAAFAAAVTPIEAISGLKIFVERNSYLYLGGGRRLGSGAAAADARLFLAFVFEPSIGDRDGDGLADDADRCPNDPEDHDQFEDEDGCPEPDDDRDQILDVDDECRLIPEDRDGEEDGDGCPEGGPSDRDGDERLDADDRCPDEPEDRDGFEDEDGCLDPDDDRDRILDVDDLCPREPEVYNGTADEDGCPDHGIVEWGEGGLTMMEPIYFQTDSAVIQRRSHRLLDAIAAAILGNPAARLLEVQGHADERGDDDYNLALTRDRAAAVVEALVERRVAEGRLRFAGFGERCPVDPRHGARAWAANRRVELRILDDAPTPEGSCPPSRALP